MLIQLVIMQRGWLSPLHAGDQDRSLHEQLAHLNAPHTHQQSDCNPVNWKCNQQNKPGLRSTLLQNFHIISQPIAHSRSYRLWHNCTALKATN